MPDMTTIPGPTGGLADEVVLPYFLPTAWGANTTLDARFFADVEFQFPSGTVTVQRSIDGANFVSWPVYDSSGAPSASASTPGIWGTDGGAFLRFSAAVTVRGGN